MQAPGVLARTRPRTWLRLSLVFNALAVLAVVHVASRWPNTSALAGFSALDKLRLGGARDALDQAGAGAGGAACGVCEAAPALCEELGSDFLIRSVAHEGSNARLRRVLSKLRRGEAITYAVVGGSVSTGHGLMVRDEKTAPSNMHRVAFDHLNARFPSPYARAHADERAAAVEDPKNAFGAVVGSSGKAEGKHGFVNGAVPASGSNYFGMCFGEHIPDDADIVIVELAINDGFHPTSFDSYERMIRALLDMPNQPAIINVHMLALMFDTIALGGDFHHSLANYYDTPIISLRNPLLPRILQQPDLVNTWFHNASLPPDLRHVGKYGHRVTGDLVSAYIDRQLCEMDAIEARAGTTDIDVLYPVEPMPRLLLTMKYDDQTVVPAMKPNCFTTASERSPLVPAEQTGWREWSWKEKKYWIADVPKSRISFKFSTVLGTVKLYYLRSREFGLGTVQCWVDDERSRAAKIEGFWHYPYNTGQESNVRIDLKPGDHTLHCELLDQTADPKGGKEFRIIGVFR